jgi:hypothetical protein
MGLIPAQEEDLVMDGCFGGYLGSKGDSVLPKLMMRVSADYSGMVAIWSWLRVKRL